MNLSLGDKVFVDGKLCKVTRDTCSGYYGVRQVLLDGLGGEILIHSSDVEVVS